jgi:hypothetical protein
VAKATWPRIGRALTVAAVTFAVSVGPALMPRTLPKHAAVARQATASTFVTVLQMNLCDSGRARCYRQLNNGRSVDEAISLVEELHQPTVITLDEVCGGDPTRIARSVPGYTSAFLPTDGTCVGRNSGQPYGIGLLVRMNQGLPRQLLSGPYSPRNQESSEIRARDCVEYAPFDVCVTHLSTVGSVAVRQCAELMADAVGYDARKPTIVAGDLNLAFGRSPDVRSCLPKGFLQRDDGDVQHVIVSMRRFEFDSAAALSMAHTDHPALLVRLRLK